MADLEPLELVVTGMGCRHCVRDVTARLRDVPGVRTVVASARTSRVRLGGTMSAADVQDALAGTTYGVRVVPPPDSDRTGRGQRIAGQS